mgnify:FL=1
MKINKQSIDLHNESLQKTHLDKLKVLSESIENSDEIIKRLIDFQIAIPSWALGTGGTRFGRFSGGGEPRGHGAV